MEATLPNIVYGFWMYSIVLVPLYIMVTLIGLFCLKHWLDGGSFLMAMFVSGAVASTTQPFVMLVNSQAIEELGKFKYYLLTGTNLTLWFSGLVLFFWIKSKMSDLLDRWQMSRASKITAVFMLVISTSGLIGCEVPGGHTDPDKAGITGEHRFQEADLRSLERGDIFVTVENGKEIIHLVIANPKDLESADWIYFKTAGDFNTFTRPPSRIADLTPTLKVVARKGTMNHEPWASKFLLGELEVQPVDQREVPIKTEIGTYHYGDQFPVGDPIVVCTVVGGEGITLTLNCPFPDLRSAK